MPILRISLELKARSFKQSSVCTASFKFITIALNFGYTYNPHTRKRTSNDFPLLIILYNLYRLAFTPSRPDKTAADPKSWVALECGATEKFSATGSYKQDIPSAVYSNFNFMRAELESGYFAIQMVPDDQDDYGRKQLKKVCSYSQNKCFEKSPYLKPSKLCNKTTYT